MHMSTSIRVSEATKAKLNRVKREEETFDELLSRLADMEDSMAESAGSWAGTSKAESAFEARERMKGSFRSR